MILAGFSVNFIGIREVRVLSHIIKRGDIYYADLSPVVGSEQGGVRPVLIIQNDLGNKFSATVIAAAISSKTGKRPLPTHVPLCAKDTGLKVDSIALLEQVRTLDKHRLKEKVGRVPQEDFREVDQALRVSFGMGGEVQYA